MLQWMINVLITLSHFLFNNFGLTIIILTIIIRLVLLPLTMRQLRATKAMSTLQPRLQELQKKYAKDRQKLAQEQMQLYKESGVNPAGCAIPMLIQFPIWIALYQAIVLTLAVNPEALLNLSRYFYSWAIPLANLPLNNSFLGMDLATGNTILAIIVGVSMWIQQKMVTPTNQDPRMQQQSQMMLWMMPIIFTFFSMSFPSGLALYWVVSNIFSIVVQYYVTGWGGLSFNFRGTSGKGGGASGGSAAERKLKKRLAQESSSIKTETPKIAKDASKEGTNDGKSGNISQNSGGSDQNSPNPLKRWFG
ncbi:MAG: membrane protein insertase YidC [Dehalococcoidales bacterium]|nr:membrane protein insertase YidC [Dehalococcoidales bacterium]